jgi:copper chaperone CopZ
MAQTSTCLVEDVTCEKCVARVEAALGSLPGVSDIVVERQPDDTALVTWTAATDIDPSEVETRIAAASAGTEHHYQVRWPA